MWVEEYKPGKFRARWRREGVKTPAASPTFPSAELAQSWADTNKLTTHRAIRLVEIIDLWRDQQPSDYRKGAAEILGNLALTRGWVQVQDLTPAAIALWQRQAGEAREAKEGGRHVARYMQYLLGVLRWAHRTYKIAIDPDVLSMRPPKAMRKPKRPLLSEEQVAAIREASWRNGPRAAMLIDYLLTYGARPITACRLTLGDLGSDSLTIGNAKHSGGWSHPVEPDHAATWRRQAYSAELTAPLFPHWQEDRPWRIVRGRANEICDWYKNGIAKRLKLPEGLRGIYDLKRYAITRMLDAGLGPADVALFTGHVDLEQVLTYNRTNETRAKKALAVLTMGAKVGAMKRAKPTKKAVHTKVHTRTHNQKP